MKVQIYWTSSFTSSCSKEMVFSHSLSHTHTHTHLSDVIVDIDGKKIGKLLTKVAPFVLNLQTILQK